MPELMGNARQLLSMCVAAAGGQLDEAQQLALSTQVVGAFATIPVVGRNIVSLAGQRDWDGLIGAIGSYIDVQEASSRTVSISAAASSTASATVSLRQDFCAAFRSIERADGLADSQKERLEELLSEMEQAASSSDRRTFAAKAAEWLGIAADSATVLTACMPFVARLFAAIAHA